MRLVAALCAMAACLLTASASQAQTQTQTIAVIGAKLYAMDGRDAVDNATIVVRDGKVAAIGPGLAAPAGAQVIDAKGRIVTPGLMNAGTQLGLVEINSVADTADQSVSSGPLGAAFDVEYALNPNSVLLPRARADGLTRAGTYPGGSASAPFAGAAAALRLSEGPDILDRSKAAMMINIGGMAAARTGGSRSAAWILLRNALTEARRFPGLSARPGPRDQLLNHLDAEALQPVLAGRMPLGIVTARESDLRQAIRLADDYHVKVVIFGGAEAWRAADLLAAHRIPVVINPFDDLPWTFDEIGARLDNAAILQRAGVTVAFSVPGIEFNHNAGTGVREAAGLAVANGLPWIEALKALTVNPAAIWGVGDHYGALTMGKDADLVIWDGDPLEPSSAPTTVLVRGRSVSLITRQDELARRYAPARRADPWPAGYR
ncbi:MAG: amidohydrolase [Phenylobacterium sp.]|nr:amidohydrolase [Phenylobacterium sp.]